MTGEILFPLGGGSVGNPLYMVPSAGSTPLSLHKLARRLSVPVFGFSFPGLADEAPPGTSIDDLSNTFVDGIRRSNAVGAVTMVGHCWGGIVALDIAAKLEQSHGAVDLLVLLESLPPSLDRDGVRIQQDADTGSMDARQALKLMLRQIESKISKSPGPMQEKLERFCSDQIEMVSHYRSRPVNCRILMIRTPCYPGSVFRGWEALSGTGYTERIVDGDQFSMLEPPFVDAVADRINGQLSRR